MENKKKWYSGYLALIAGSVALFGFTACQEDENLLLPKQNIIETASDNSDFSTLVSAVEEANLTETLSGSGPFTVFAPTNQAFGEYLLKNNLSSSELFADPDLNDLLRYHVILGTKLSSDLKAGVINSLEGRNFYISEDPSGSLWINGSAKITETDVLASNGVIHVLDGVYVTPSQSIAEIVKAAAEASNPEFTQLVAALTRVNLIEAVDGGVLDNLTVFAPTDAAFQQLYDDLGVSGLRQISDENLSSILRYHVVPSRSFSQDLRQDAKLLTLLERQSLAVDLTNMKINESGLIPSSLNIHGVNGVIHAIDRVLLPINL